MKQGKTHQRKPSERGTAKSGRKEKGGEFVPIPPRRRPLLLAVSGLLIVAWIVFLAIMAFRH